MKGRVTVTVIVAVVVIIAVGYGVHRLVHASGPTKLPTAEATQGEFLVIVEARGSLVAGKSVALAAPHVGGLQIVWLAPPGSVVNKGDPVVKFDPTAEQKDLQGRLATLHQQQATLDQATAQAKITSEQDKLSTATAQTNVELAKLDLSKAAILSVIEGDESKINLQTAQEALKVQQATVNLDNAGSAAKIASAQRERDKAQYHVNQDKKWLSEMVLRAPSNGMVIYQMNRSQGWLNAKPFKVGDSVWPRATIAKIPDLNTLQMVGNLEEVDRGKVSVGQPVRVHVDAMPAKTFDGTLTSISALTEPSFDGGFPPKQSFHAYGSMTHVGPRLRPGMNGTLDIVVKRIPNAISIPSQALFTLDGKPVVYVQGKKGYQPVPVKVLARNPDAVAVSGLPAGTEVTLVDPNHPQGGGAAAGSAAGGGGRAGGPAGGAR